MLQLLEAGAIQAKLRVSQPGDPDEVEADRAAEKVLAKSRAPAIQRKCACEGGSPCSKCAAQEEETIHRRVATPRLHSLQPSIQRAPADPTSTSDPVPAAPQTQPPGAKTSGTLVVEDNATKVEPYQMRKSQFIALLRTNACAAADRALASVKHTTKGCPYVAKWLSFYEKQSSEHIERAIHQYAPEAVAARSAHEAIRIIVTRVERAAITWAKTGKVVGMPKELANELPGQGGFLGAVQSVASSKVGGAILGFIGGTKKRDDSDDDQVQRKAQNAEPASARNAASVQAQLGRGHSLDSRVRSQMSSAFGRDFSRVRVHTDSDAAKLSSDLNARAFTVGFDVAFASGEYKPGTLIGDALIAHELAHVVQQSTASRFSASTTKSPMEYDFLEQNADESAVRAIAETRLGTNSWLSIARANTLPRLKSGLKLQRCAHTSGPASAPKHAAPQAPAVVPDRFDQCAIVAADLQDEKIRARIHALSREQLNHYKSCNHDPQVNAYIDQILAISTPVPVGATFQGAGQASVVVGGVNVTILPDVHRRRALLDSSAETTIDLLTTPDTWHARGGRITDFKVPVASATIQTHLNPGISQTGQSGYGKGTAREDIAAGHTTLGFHEGSHGSDYLEFFAQNPFPVFEGAVGMTEREFHQAEHRFVTAVQDYNTRLHRFSELRTDCVGKKIDEFKREHHQRITVHCP